jgi:polysaccharide deacetylase family protein (PEP-CTERM system associated)
MIAHLLTFDVEDWFHLLDTPAAPSPKQWHRLESRVERNTRRLLDLCEGYRQGATFFVLGWVAERFPDLIAEIARRGFEVASHGFGHVLVSEVGPAGFRDDVLRSIDAIERATGARPRGFRAAGFSITPRCVWAFDTIAAAGFDYDASIFPGRHGHGGMPVRHRGPFLLETPGGAELPCYPIAAVDVFGRPFAFGGGGYFRLLPQPVFHGCLRFAASQGHASTVYLHPRDIDADQPRLDGLPALRRFKSYVGVGDAEERFERLLQDFRFLAIGQHLDAPGVQSAVRSRFLSLRRPL